MMSKDNKAGFVMNAALLGTMLLTAAASAYLFLQQSSPVVNFSMIPICLIGMLIAFSRGVKLGALWTLVLGALLAVLSAIFWPAQLTAFIFWILWAPVALFSVNKLRTGVNGLMAERDFYRSECARIAMVDSITQMRNMHAYLNDAPIYIKIARRYNLTMVVLALKLKNNDELKAALEEVAYNELLEAISRVMRNSVRLEDLAYFINNESGVWCINMFTHLESIDVVVSRIQKGLETVRPDHGDGAPVEPEFLYGYATYAEEEDLTPIMLLQRAIDMAEGRARPRPVGEEGRAPAQ